VIPVVQEFFFLTLTYLLPFSEPLGPRPNFQSLHVPSFQLKAMVVAHSTEIFHPVATSHPMPMIHAAVHADLVVDSDAILSIWSMMIAILKRPT
jgi:hypothetical protein